VAGLAADTRDLKKSPTSALMKSVPDTMTNPLQLSGTTGIDNSRFGKDNHNSTNMAVDASFNAPRASDRP